MGTGWRVGRHVLLCVGLVLGWVAEGVAEGEPGAGGSPAAVYVSAAHGLRVPIPAGWQVLDKSQPQALGEALGQPLPGLICLAKETPAEDSPTLLVTFDLLEEDTTLEAYAAVLKQRNEEIMHANPDLAYVENANLVTLGDRVYSRTVLHAGDDWLVYYHVVRGRISYTVSGSAPRTDAERHAQLFDEVVAGLDLDQQAGAAGWEVAEAEDLALWAGQAFGRRQFDRAITLGEAALAKQPNDPVLKAQILFNLSSSYLDRGTLAYIREGDASFYEKALARAQECVALEPTHWRALANIATVHMNMGHLAEADDYFQRAEQHVESGSPFSQQLLGQHALVRAMLKAKETPAR